MDYNISLDYGNFTNFNISLDYENLTDYNDTFEDVGNITDAFDLAELFTDFVNQQDIPYHIRMLFIFLYSLSAFLAIVGNVLVMLVLLIRKRMTKGVRFSLVNLAIADLLIAVFCIPFTCSKYVNNSWLYSSATCTMVLFMQDATQIVSVLTLTVIGIDRYFAILFPFKFHWLRSDFAVTIGVLLTWIVAVAQCAVILFFSHSEKYAYTEHNFSVQLCYYMWPSTNMELGYVLSNFLISFAVPLVILIFTYSSITWKLIHRVSPGNADAARDQQQHQNMIKVIKMLFLIVLLFTICWSPVKIFIMVSWVNKKIMLALSSATSRVIYLVLYWISMSNCVVNPFIYSFSNDNFWNDVKFIFQKYICCRKSRDPPSHNMSGLSNCSNTTTASQLSLQKM